MAHQACSHQAWESDDGYLWRCTICAMPYHLHRQLPVTFNDTETKEPIAVTPTHTIHHETIPN